MNPGFFQDPAMIFAGLGIIVILVGCAVIIHRIVNAREQSLKNTSNQELHDFYNLDRQYFVHAVKMRDGNAWIFFEIKFLNDELKPCVFRLKWVIPSSKITITQLESGQVEFLKISFNPAFLATTQDISQHEDVWGVFASFEAQVTSVNLGLNPERFAEFNSVP